MSADVGRPWRIGVDIGGTFTDGIIWNEVTGERGAAKVPSTPGDLSRGLLAVVERLLEQEGLSGREVGYLAHGTTVATNAVIEHQLAPIAYVTTAGFRDVFEIARQVRPDPHDVFTVKPPPLVPRNHCHEVRERTSAQGAILTDLDEASVFEVVEVLRDSDVRAVAVCMLHSYANPSHERRVAGILRERLPDVLVTASSDLVTEFREYPRACTVAINAGLIPLVGSYLEDIEARLRALGLDCELRVMQSNGGVLAFAEARTMPVRILESGPAAGVIGAVRVGQQADSWNLISFDMGGTTAKLGLIREGNPSMSQEFEVGEQSRGRSWFTGASGYPILVPSIDLVEIGAGGGSVAWVDSGGKLRVGPRSAGAIPGPACVAQGGVEPTVTDANLVLGRLSPDGLLGGDLPVDIDAATAAIRGVAEATGLSITEAALGIVAIANAAMVGAMRTVSIQRGYDPRAFTLVPFGGSGPLHALALAQDMGIERVLVQPQPGIASALGLLVTDVRHEFSTTLVQPLDLIHPVALRASFEALEARGHAALEREGIHPLRRSMERSVEMRYLGQSYQLVVRVPSGSLGRGELDQLATEFHRQHERAYGYAEPGEPMELVNYRVTAVGEIAKPERIGRWEVGGRPRHEPSTRPVCFDRSGYVDTSVLWRRSLTVDSVVTGPAVIEELDSTTLVHPGWLARVTESWDLLLTHTADTDPERGIALAAAASAG
jgi:N-methylhydantoinase A